ncbi:MAG: peptidylprolyl isomerase [Gemmatimonadota bacterium]
MSRPSARFEMPSFRFDMPSISVVLVATLATMAGGATLLSPAPASAQQASPLALEGEEGLVDRVVAVVGDSVVLESQLLDRMRELRAQGAQVPDDPTALARFQRDLLENLVNEQLILQAAVKDTTISVPAERVTEVVSQDLEERAQEFGGQDALRQALQQAGMTMAEYRERLRAQARAQLLQNQYLSMRQSRDASSIPVSESELREYFEENRQSIGQRPASISFEQVVVRPRPSDSALEEARAEARAVLDSLQQGLKSFEELAAAHSDDPGSRDQGGSLGWFRRGQMVPAFEDAVFSLREGAISGVVESRFGFHIIRVDRVRGSERRARHILVSPQVTPEDVEEARERAREMAQRLRSGASVDSLQAETGTEENLGSISVLREQLTRLPSPYLDPLRNARSEDILGPIEWTEQGQSNFAVLEVTDVREEGSYTFEEVRPQVRQQLQQQKLLEEVFAELREETHVEIRI